MDLKQKKCQPCESGQQPMGVEAAQSYMGNIPDWEIDDNYQSISRTFKFKGFYKTMAFVNAVAWVAHCESHHPDLEVGFNYCTVHYSTHAIGGLSENDFISAAKVDALFD